MRHKNEIKHVAFCQRRQEAHKLLHSELTRDHCTLIHLKPRFHMITGDHSSSQRSLVNCPVDCTDHVETKFLFCQLSPTIASGSSPKTVSAISKGTAVKSRSWGAAASMPYKQGVDRALVKTS